MQVRITENIYSTGDIHHCYLVTGGEKTALIDTIPQKRSEELFEFIDNLISVEDIDYLILNHTEQNKSGCVSALLSANPNIEVVTTTAGMRNLKEMINGKVLINEHIAKDNEEIDLGGGIVLKFLITPNLNWPDSMMTYEKKNRALFSCDMFSQFPVLPDFVEFARQNYYEELLGHFEDYVRYALDRISELDIDFILPGYGRGSMGENAGEVIKKYRSYTEVKKKKGKTAAVVYSSTYNCTGEMAECITNTLAESGFICTTIHVDFLQKEYRTDKALQEADVVVVGTNTENRGASEAIIKAIAELNPLIMRNKPFFVFGSYGWSGEGTQIVHNLLASYGMKPFSKPFTSIFNMSDDKRAELIKHTQKFAEFICKENGIV